MSSTGVSSKSTIVEQARWLADAALDLLFPPRCAACRRAGSLLCDACLAEFQPVPLPICRVCGEPVTNADQCVRCAAESRCFESVRSAFLYQGTIQPAIHAFKYKRQSRLAAPLALAMSTSVAPTIDPTTVLCPVPLHPVRQKARGYNQSELLARHLAAAWSITLLPPNALTRSRDTAAQVGKKYTERQRNVGGAFAALPDAVAGRAILLVDDVCTTGATLNACAEALLEAGALTVNAVTLARAV